MECIYRWHEHILVICNCYAVSTYFSSKKVKQTKEALNQKQKKSINDQEGFV